MVYGKSGISYSHFTRKNLEKSEKQSSIVADYNQPTMKSFLPNVPPLEMSEENLRIIRSEICRLTHPQTENYRSREIAVSEPFRSVIRRFYLALDAYLESSNPVMTAKDVISEVVTNFEAPKFFKRFRIKSFIKTKKLILLEDPPWYEDHPFSDKIKDIGDVFNFMHCIHWMEEVDDYKKGFIPVKIDPDRLKSFKDMCWDLLPDPHTFRRIAPEEILLKMTSSKQIIPTSENQKTIENWKLKSQFLTFSEGPIIGKRTVIQVAPDGARDTVILPIDVANSISYIDKQIHEIIQGIPGNGMFDDPLKILKKTISFRRKYDYFLCRDFEKEGITKPRVLLDAALEIICEKYPELTLLKRLKGIYKDFKINVDGEILSPDRGHGLGMANSLTTLIQIIVFRLTINELEAYELHPDRKLAMLAYNDDFVAGFDSEDVLEAYWEYEGIVLDQLGLIRKPQKSFKGNDFVFCEIYNSHLNRKESYLRREVLNTLACTNIVQAKELFMSLDTVVNHEILDIYKEEIKTYWGFEFTPKEKDLPFRFGGWSNRKYKNIDLCLNDLRYDVHLNALFEANKIHSVRAPMRGCSKTQFISPLSKLYNIDPKDFDKSVKNRLYLGSEREVSTSFNRISMNPYHLKHEYFKMAEDRKNRYAKELNKPQTYIEQIIEKLQEESPETTFLEFNCARKIVTYQTRTKKKTERVWDIPNPVMSYIKYLYPEKIPDLDIDPNPLGLMLKLKPEGRKFLNPFEKYLVDKDFTNLKLQYQEDFEVEKYLFDFGEDKDLVESKYLNPQQVAEVCFLVGEKFPIPDHICDSTKELISLKNGLYKRDHTRELRIPRVIDFDNFKYLMDLNDFSFEREIEEVWKAYREVFFEIKVEEPPEVKKLETIIEEESIFSLEDYNGSTADLFWGWKASPENHRPLYFFKEIDDLLTTLGAYDSSQLLRVIEINSDSREMTAIYFSMIGVEVTHVDGWPIPVRFLHEQKSIFSDDEEEGIGGFFDD